MTSTCNHSLNTRPGDSATCSPPGQFQITTYHEKTQHFCWWNAFDDMCRMGRWSFWSWFQVNRSTFDEDMHEKMIFTLSFSLTLTFDL